MRTTRLLLIFASLLVTAPAAAQLMSPAERATAVSRARELAGCLDAHHNEMQRIMRLLVAAERQRDTSTDAAARRDAESAIEALVIRSAGVQTGARECLSVRVPTPGATVVVEPPPPDAVADSVAGTGGSLPTVERDARLAEYIHVVTAQQVDGSGQLDDHVVQSAVRRATAGLERCYEQHLDRGSMEPATLDLVFTFRGAGAARDVAVENSHFDDATFDRCVRTAAAQIRTSSAPRGGDAQYSYRLRFGRPPAP